MRNSTIAALAAIHLLLAGPLASAQETPLVVIKDSEGGYAHGSKENLAKLVQLIDSKGSVVVWITLDPGYVGFSPGLTGMSEAGRAAQDARTARELHRLLRPLVATQRAAAVNTASGAQFGTSGMYRISDVSALNHILASPAVVLVTLAGL